LENAADAPCALNWLMMDAVELAGALPINDDFAAVEGTFLYW
jgi:hypothetical protein